MRFLVWLGLVLLLPLSWVAWRTESIARGSDALGHHDNGKQEAPASTRRVLSDNVLADWEVRRQSVNTIEVVLEGTRTYPRGSENGDPDMPEGYTEDFPPEDCTFPVTYKFHIDFKKNRYRSEESRKMISFGSDAPAFVDRHAIFVYDGEVIWYDQLHRDNSGCSPQLEIISPNETFFSSISITESPLFFSLGVVRTSNILMNKMDTLQPTAPEFSYVRDVQYGERACRLMQTSSALNTVARGHWELIVDSSRGSLPLRYTSFIGNALDYRADLDYVEEVGEWRLAGWTYTRWNQPDWVRMLRTATSRGTAVSLRITTSLKVTKWQTNLELPSDLFRHEPRPDTVVSNRITKEYYRFNSDGSKTPLDRYGKWPQEN